MIFKMDAEAVRGMAARFRAAADAMELGTISTNRNVQSAPWQSQAREEFILEMEVLHNSILQSAEVLLLMGTAAEQKASQWEAVGNMFNGPFPAISGVWNRLKSIMGGLWSRIRNAVRGIKWPSVPKYVVPATTGGVVLGAFIKKPSWLTWPPKWWPPKWPWQKPEPQPQPQPVPAPAPPVKPLPSKPISFEKTAEEVPAGTMTAVNYRRGISKDVKANCTWYAAHAVEVASGGKIKIDSPGYPKLGDAGNWANNCMKDPPPPGVTGVDDNATAGSVFCVGTHVGFVENVFIQDGETYITWSEEGWGRDECPWTGGVRVDVGDDSVYRYRITMPLSKLTSHYQRKGEEIKYIHFNYENP
jgi:hypothetical protein